MITYADLLKNELIQVKEVNFYQKTLIADEVYEILYKAYENVSGKLHFKDVNELVETTDK